VTQTHIIDGKEYASQLRLKIASVIQNCEPLFTPGLATILVGHNAASQIYIRNKIKISKELGIRSTHLDFESNISEYDLLAEIHKLNKNEAVDGILVQMPLPDHIDPYKIIEAIDPQKDVDGFHPLNSAKLYANRDALYPCTPLGCLFLLKKVIDSLNGLRALVIGRSSIVGKPLSLMLLHENATVTIAHSYTIDLKELCLESDIIIAALGRPHFIRGDWIKPGAIIIDVGINRDVESESKKITGDVCFEEALGRASAITPVPGGVGPMTIACLMYNTLKAAHLRRGLAIPDILN
jgi:methylenetetrahydrofolate dehydrogenase (NADP+)/methenyltetrahydrofolate cyclohydrolase